MESRHVTFDETKFLGAPYLVQYLDDENTSDGDHQSASGSESSQGESESGDEEAFSVNGGGESEDSETPIEDALSGNEDGDSDGNTDNCSLENPESPLPENDLTCLHEELISAPVDGSNDEDDGSVVEELLETQPETRYPQRNRRSTPSWYIASSAKMNSEGRSITVTTADDPTLLEALSATQEEKSLWHSALDAEYNSLHYKNTWVEDDNPGAQPLPTHPVLKIKRLRNGQVDRLKARVVAGGSFQTCGENYMETYAPVVSFSVVRMFLYLVLFPK